MAYQNMAVGWEDDYWAKGRSFSNEPCPVRGAEPIILVFPGLHHKYYCDAFRTYKPRPPLSDFIEHFWLYEGYTSEYAQREYVPLVRSIWCSAAIPERLSRDRTAPISLPRGRRDLPLPGYIFAPRVAHKRRS